LLLPALFLVAMGEGSEESRKEMVT